MLPVLWIACTLLPAAELPPPTGATVVAPDARLEKLFTRTAPIQGGLTEGPAVAPDGSIYFTDIPSGPHRGMILRFDPATGKTTVFRQDSRMANGLQFDAEGRLVACEGADGGGRRVSRHDLKTGKNEVLADRFDGKHFNSPNDLDIDRKGRIYFTDPRYVGKEPRELEHRAVYRIDPDGKVSLLTREVEMPNGIAVAPDGKTLYLADTNSGANPVGEPLPRGAMKVYAFPLDADGKVAGPRRVLYDFGEETGCDGMTLDAKGNLYLTCRSARRPGVLVLTPQGKELAHIPTGPSQPDAATPTGLPSNVTFGAGDDRHTLYVTVDQSLYRIRLKTEGLPPLWQK